MLLGACLKPMGFAHQGLWVMCYRRVMGYGLWVMGCKSPPTNSVDSKWYGISEVMGYLMHGL